MAMHADVAALPASMAEGMQGGHGSAAAALRFSSSSSARRGPLLLGVTGALVVAAIVAGTLCRRGNISNVTSHPTLENQALGGVFSARAATAPLRGLLAYTCASLACPAGFVLRADSLHVLCGHERLGGGCGQADVQMCCEIVEPACRPGTTLDFGGSSLLHNNLDGQGPGSGEPGLTIRDVLPSGRSGAILNLEIFAAGPYIPQAELVDLNGLHAHRFGRLAVRDGTSLDLLLRFVDDASWRPALVGPFFFTVFNLEGASLGIGGLEKYFVSEPSDVNVEVGEDGLVWFSAGIGSTGSRTSEPELPTDPLALTEAQRRRAVSLLLSPGTSFSLTYRVWQGSNAGTLLFAGPSSLSCASTPSQAAFSHKELQVTEPDRPGRPSWLDEQVVRDGVEQGDDGKARAERAEVATTTTVATTTSLSSTTAATSRSTTRPGHVSQNGKQVFDSGSKEGDDSKAREKRAEVATTTTAAVTTSRSSTTAATSRSTTRAVSIASSTVATTTTMMTATTTMTTMRPSSTIAKLRSTTVHVFDPFPAATKEARHDKGGIPGNNDDRKEEVVQVAYKSSEDQASHEGSSRETPVRNKDEQNVEKLRADALNSHISKEVKPIIDRPSKSKTSEVDSSAARPAYTGVYAYTGMYGFDDVYASADRLKTQASTIVPGGSSDEHDDDHGDDDDDDDDDEEEQEDDEMTEGGARKHGVRPSADASREERSHVGNPTEDQKIDGSAKKKHAQEEEVDQSSDDGEKDDGEQSSNDEQKEDHAQSKDILKVL